MHPSAHPEGSDHVKTPRSRGAGGPELLALLALDPDQGVGRLHRLHEAVVEAVDSTDDIIRDPDLQLSLFCLNALHYDGLDDVADGWEWQTGLLAVRVRIERAFEAAPRRR